MTSLPQGSTAPVTAPSSPALPGAPAGGSPSQIFRALQSQRSVLGDQMEQLQSMRRDVVTQLLIPNMPAATKASLEKRLASVDDRVGSLDKQIAASDQAMAQAAAVPGSTVQSPRPQPGSPDPDMLAGLLFVLAMAVVIPFSIAGARRIWRRSAVGEVRLPAEMTERMGQIERGVEAIALEVERIGEGQRFLTQAMVERGDVRALREGERLPLPRRGEERR